MSSKKPQAGQQAGVTSVKDLIAQIDKTLVELGKLTGYGPDYTDAKAKWAEIKVKFKAKSAALAQKQKAQAADGAKNPKATVGAGTKDEPAKRPEPQKSGKPKSVVITPHSLECYLGSFAVEALAKRDASEFLSNDKVFWYRRALFPDPTAAKVQPKVMSVRVVERNDARFTRAPYTVWVDINIQGDPVHCRAWAEGVVNKNRGDQE